MEVVVGGADVSSLSIMEDVNNVEETVLTQILLSGKRWGGLELPMRLQALSSISLPMRWKYLVLDSFSHSPRPRKLWTWYSSP